MALGLTTTSTLQNFWSKNTRRCIIRAYPNGGAPLNALLSLSNRDESTPSPEFSWQEDRWKSRRALTIAGATANAPFYDDSNNVLSTGFNLTGSTSGGGTTLRVYISSEEFQVNDVVGIYGVTIAAGKTLIQGRITNKGTSGGKHYIDISNELATTSVTNASAVQIGLHVVLNSTAYAEGSRSKKGTYKFPTLVSNYTQIQKTVFDLTRTALKQPLEYNETGDYKERAYQAGIEHMVLWERAFLFGNRSAVSTTNESSDPTILRQTGGLRWALRQWEKGSVAAGGLFEYGESDVSAADWRSTPSKRLIDLSSATITGRELERLFGYAFEKQVSHDFDKLVFVGPDAWTNIAAFYGNRVQMTCLADEGFEGFNFKMQSVVTSGGTLHFKQHPLFASSPELRSSVYVIDMGCPRWMPLTDSDTIIQENVQDNDADIRKDMYLTEAGFEWNVPESCMIIDNLGAIA